MTNPNIGEPPEHQDGRDSITLLDELARKRREDAEVQSTVPPPDFIESIERTEVRYTFRPIDLPLNQIDASSFLSLMRENYKNKLDDLDISPLLKMISREKLISLSDADALQLLIQEGLLSQFSFKGGKFPLKYDFIEIKRISITFESITVLVGGRSQIAETVAQESLQMLWSSAGSSRTWERIGPQRRMISYGTETRVRLPFQAEKLINNLLMDYLSSEMEGGNKFLTYATGVSARNNFTPSPSITGIVNLDELVLRVNTFDKVSGQSDGQVLRFSVTSRDDYGMGELKITSTMDSDTHIKFVASLIDRVRSA